MLILFLILIGVAFYLSTQTPSEWRWPWYLAATVVAAIIGIVGMRGF